MPSRLEDYALIGDCQTAALVSREGSIDWLCLPRFDSGACFAALLGSAEHGRWWIHPSGEVRATRRSYRGNTLVLETEFETPEGKVALIDFMPIRQRRADLIRLVEGRGGRVPMHMELSIRFDYGSIVPWVRRNERGLTAIAGPDMLDLFTTVDLHGQNYHTLADFEVQQGQRISFDLVWQSSLDSPPEPLDPMKSLEETEEWWREWTGRGTHDGHYQDAVRRSLITLKALTYAPSGGIVAAPTTSLPECLGGVRNWDYRYCWLRDATFTLLALMYAGYQDEAAAWREWLLRAVAGKPSQMRILYGITGERRLPEIELPWLPGYENSSPVRVGNAASRQFQLDVYGEVADVMHQCLRAGIEVTDDGRRVELELLDFLESAWSQPDSGIWEMRGPAQQFTHSKVMAWVAFDRAVKAVESSDVGGRAERWRALRDTIKEEVCKHGFNERLGTFVQSYGSDRLDASLLMIPLVGFLPAEDPMVVGTIRAIEERLMEDGFVRRYDNDVKVDGLPEGEASFLLCSFWLADCLSLVGRREDAVRLFERLLSIRNDVGLLSEAYDTKNQRLLGNFPQAFSHVGLINTARNLSRIPGPAEHRRKS